MILISNYSMSDEVFNKKKRKEKDYSTFRFLSLFLFCYKILSCIIFSSLLILYI